MFRNKLRFLRATRFSGQDFLGAQLDSSVNTLYSLSAHYFMKRTVKYHWESRGSTITNHRMLMRTSPDRWLWVVPVSRTEMGSYWDISITIEIYIEIIK